uniref:Reverse transcriptase domain-containing protein n=1 Tax=Tanacetum cinerariifolium TaxID=118510 RepID=A0A699IZ52_TANCI|nr:reverse transcriptase domain-containing protein [Tanacetum cinerariifolium]
MTTTEFTNYMMANDAILKNMQTNMTSLINSNLELKNMFGQFMKMNTTSSSSSRTLSSNTVTNPKEDLKGITTRSGTAYQGLMIPTTSSSLPKVVKRETKKNWDPGKFLIPYDFLEMDKCLALADLDASINLMPLSVWNKLSLPELTPTLMTLKLADQSISRPNGVAKDVYVKVGKFHFPADFVAVHFDADPRVPLILGRSFLKTRRALFDVYAGELPFRVNNEAVTFNLDQTLRYSANYNDMMVNRIDVIDMACEEYLQEVLGFFDVIMIDAFLALEDDATSPEVDHSFFDTEGDIIFLESFLNDDPSLTPPNQGMDLPPHLKYAFLEGDDKLPVIIATDLSVEEKAVLIKVLKSHKQAIAWELSNIKGWRVYIDYHKLNEATHNDHFPLPFMDQMLERLAGNEYYSFIDEKSHFMVKEGIVLGHKISKNGIEVDKAKVDVIAKLPHPTTVKGIRSFLGYAGFYRRFIQYFSKIAWPMTRLLEKDTLIFFSKECVEAFQTLKKKLTEAPILIASTGTYPLSLCAMQATLP